MEEDPSRCQDAAKLAAGEGLGAEVQLDDVVGTHPEYNEEEEEQKYFRRKRLGVVKNVLAASLAATLTYGVYLGLLQMQLILHYDETYREVKYSNMELEDIDRKVLMGINVTPVAALLYTPVLIRFFGTKWTMFLAVGIYALFVSSNYWERYFTLVPSAVAIGVAIVPLWASVGHYITRMAQKYYEYANYKEEHVQEQRQAPRGACSTYVVIFQTIFYACFHLSFVCAQMPMLFFLNNYLYQLNHTLYGVKHCGERRGRLGVAGAVPLGAEPRRTPRRDAEPRHAARLQQDGAAQPAPQRQPHHRGERPDGGRLPGHAGGECGARREGPGGHRHLTGRCHRQVLLLCGSAYRPTEEIDLRSIGWGNIFQLPFKHMRDYRLRHLLPFFIYSGFEVLFVCTGFSLVRRGVGIGVAAGGRRGRVPLSLSSLQNYGVCALGLEKLAYLLMAYGFSASACSSLALCTLRLRRQCPLLAGAFVHAAILVTLFCWAPEPRHVVQAPLLYSIAVLWGMGSALNKTGISILLGMLYEDKERQDFVFTIYHWWQALAIFTVYLWSGLPMKAKLSIMLLALGLAAGSYLWMERKLAQRVAYRLPRIPRPRHKMKGYRYLEDDDSDETASEGEGASRRHQDDDEEEEEEEGDHRHPAKADGGDELPKDERERMG
ncbi:protein unc-93 homolog B1 isoform X2 [Anas acuta]|uniref:protein unc-93 homolog B1 isoform X2 n=1 Tax=Anas acuta TaxID=28680 RepID=UPI0035C91698